MISVTWLMWYFTYTKNQLILVIFIVIPFALFLARTPLRKVFKHKLQKKDVVSCKKL